ncbi:hypothetical protein [Mesorhizobium caraganae]|nr:hypothetical protein [Mesorhizobium caraganae]
MVLMLKEKIVATIFLRLHQLSIPIEHVLTFRRLTKRLFRFREADFMILTGGNVVRRYSTSPRPVTPERIERALDRVAEIIVARGKQGEALLPLYDHLERALQDLHNRDERLAEVRERVKQFQS